MEQNLNIASKEGIEFEDATKYKQHMGSLLYLTTTIHEISFAIGPHFQVHAKTLRQTSMSYKESYGILEGYSKLSTQILKDGRVQINWIFKFRL